MFKKNISFWNFKILQWPGPGFYALLLLNLGSFPIEKLFPLSALFIKYDPGPTLYLFLTGFDLSPLPILKKGPWVFENESFG